MDKGRVVDAEVGTGGPMDAVRVLAAYDEGVKAIETASLAVVDWNASTPCATARRRRTAPRTPKMGPGGCSGMADNQHGGASISPAMCCASPGTTTVFLTRR